MIDLDGKFSIMRLSTIIDEKLNQCLNEHLFSMMGESPNEQKGIVHNDLTLFFSYHSLPPYPSYTLLFFSFLITLFSSTSCSGPQ